MRNTYINRSGKLLSGVAIGMFATACAALCVALASGASAMTQPSHVAVPKSVRLIYVTLMSPSGGSITTGKRLQTHNYTLTSAATLKSVDQLVNRLDTVSTRAVACPMFILADQPKLTLVFRASANGAALAEIQVNVETGPDHDSGDSACSPIHYWVRGKSQPALISKTFVASIGHVISADIS